MRHSQFVQERLRQEPRYLQIDGIAIEIGRACDLADFAAKHDGNTVGKRCRLGLVVGHEQRRRFHFLVEPRDLAARMDAQRCVEVRQRLVHQEDLRLTHHGAPQCHTLPLSTGKCRRTAIEQRSRA